MGRSFKPADRQQGAHQFRHSSVGGISASQEGTSHALRFGCLLVRWSRGNSDWGLRRPRHPRESVELLKLLYLT